MSIWPVEPPLPRRATEAHLPRSGPRLVAAGWRDLTLEPGSSLAYGFAVFVVSVAIVAGLFFLGLDYILFPGTRGLHGGRPARRHRPLRKEPPDRGRQTGFAGAHDLRQASLRRPGLFTGVLLVLLMLLWMRAAVILYALFFGLRPFPGLDHLAPMLFTTGIGWAMLVTGTVVGGVFRRVLFRDQRFFRPDAARRADRRLYRDGHEHLPGLEQSTGLDRLGRDCAFADRSRPCDGLVGLIVVFPLLGHATWHAYKAMR